MKTSALIAGFWGIFFLTSVYADTDIDKNAAEAKGIIKEFFASLKGELQSAIKTGGPVSAIPVCKQRAPDIAQAMSAKSGWDVGRTSLKLRNPGLNAPDEWEEQVLRAFERRKTAGDDVKTMTYAEVVPVNGEKRYRFMKAIPTGEVCILCHGDSISSDITAALDESYSDDKARGFKVGDIRGAFTLSKPL